MTLFRYPHSLSINHKNKNHATAASRKNKYIDCQIGGLIL